MADNLPIHIPQEYVNDDTVKLLKWFVKEGEEIQEGSTIAEVETSKAVVELAATSSGRVLQRAKVGEEVRVGDVIGYISSNGTSAAPASSASESTSQIPAAPDLPSATRFSKKALQLIRANGIAPSVFAGRGLVREQDVDEYIESHERRRESEEHVHFALQGIPLDRVSFPRTWKDPDVGKIDAEFLARLRKAPEEFARLSSQEKCDGYRAHGAVIGENVVLAAGTVLVASHIVIGAGAYFGENSSIHCRERFAAGPLTSFRQASIRGGTVVLGESIFGGAKVQIGGGGHGDPYSVLCIGDGTYVGDEVFINICRPILMGREVFLTQRSILVTHNIGHSILEGYENRFAPIVLEDYAQVGMNSTIYAGSRVGSGSIVMSNSYVVSSIPPGKLAGGIPARVLREATRPVDRNRQLEIVETMIREYLDCLARRGHAVSELAAEAKRGFRLEYQGKHFSLLFVEKAREIDREVLPGEGAIVWTLEGTHGPAGDYTLMNLLSKKIIGPRTGVFVETTREFLRKRGIRLEPGPWRYSGGLI